MTRQFPCFGSSAFENSGDDKIGVAAETVVAYWPAFRVRHTAFGKGSILIAANSIWISRIVGHDYPPSYLSRIGLTLSFLTTCQKAFRSTRYSHQNLFLERKSERLFLFLFSVSREVI